MARRYREKQIIKYSDANVLTHNQVNVVSFTAFSMISRWRGEGETR